MPSDDTSALKTQIRLTAQVLRHTQEKIETQAKIAKRDVATLLQQKNLEMARSKAAKLLEEDNRGRVLATLEGYCVQLLERFDDMEPSNDEPTSAVAEAVTGIIFSAPGMEIKELHRLRDLLSKHYNPEFTRSLMTSRVSPELLSKLHPLRLSASELDAYLVEIARANDLHWALPYLDYSERLRTLGNNIDPSSSVRTVDISILRQACSRGIPNGPPWLRPNLWKLLFGYIPPEKNRWYDSLHRSRSDYYDLARKFLTDLATLPSPPHTAPLSPSDAKLLALSKDLARVPRHLQRFLEEPDSPGESCPFSANAPVGLRIENASAVDDRLELIRRRGRRALQDTSPTPVIRIEHEDVLPSETNTSQTEVAQSQQPDIVLPTFEEQHSHHSTSILRILYVHSMLNPTRSSSLASVLAPIYYVFIHDVEGDGRSDSATHAEADAFWVFEEIVRELDDVLEDGDEMEGWMKTFGERLKWADDELWADLDRKGLNPSSPYYSIRWLTTILAHTVPLQSLLVLWDALFSLPQRSANSNPKADFLIDIMTAMLMRSRTVLFRLGRARAISPGLWGEENITVPPPSPAFPSQPELGESFIQGMKMLQDFAIDDFGGAERVLDVAWDLWRKRERERLNLARKESSGPGFGARLRETVWRGITNQVIEEESSPEPSRESSDTEEKSNEPLSRNPAALGLGGRLREAAWKGFTNQIDSNPSSPNPETSDDERGNETETPSTSFSPPDSSTTGASKLWSYAERLRDSDAAAALAKTGTNWRVKALDAWNVRSQPAKPSTSTAPSDSLSSDPTTQAPEFTTSSNNSNIFTRRSSLKVRGWGLWNGSNKSIEPDQESQPENQNRADDNENYSAPPRPKFKPVRDSIIPTFASGAFSHPGTPLSSRSSSEPPSPPASDPGIVNKAHGLQAALAALSGTSPHLSQSPSPPPKAGPRPLRLNALSLITPSTSQSRNRDSSTQWSHVRANSAQPSRRASQSSANSSQLAPSPRIPTHNRRTLASSNGTAISQESFRRPSDLSRSRPRDSLSSVSSRGSDSAGESGILPLNRSVSPLATQSQRRRQGEAILELQPSLDRPDSPSTLPASPPPPTPTTSTTNSRVTVQQASDPVETPAVKASALPVSALSLHRKKSWKVDRTPKAAEKRLTLDSTTDDGGFSNNVLTPRIRGKRYGGTRPTGLKLRDPSLRPGDRSTSPSPSPSPASAGGLFVPTSKEDGEEKLPTPRATTFEATRSPRRTRKEISIVVSDSDKADDEDGYGDFLSAYETEDGEGLQLFTS